MGEHVDVLIGGGGLSGIGAAYHVQQAFPKRKYVILESRDAIGGTWGLFRYPGVRSDTTMQTRGYRFRPWTGDKAIADGPSILRYVRDTAAEAGIDRHIRFGYRVTGASWSSADARWTVEATHQAPPPAPHPKPSPSPATSCLSVPVTTATTTATGPTFRGSRTSAARWCIRSSGRTTWTTPVSG